MCTVEQSWNPGTATAFQVPMVEATWPNRITYDETTTLDLDANSVECEDSECVARYTGFLNNATDSTARAVAVVLIRGAYGFTAAATIARSDAEERFEELGSTGARFLSGACSLITPEAEVISEETS